MATRRGGTIQLVVNGELQDAKGEFTYMIATETRTGIVGADRPHGYSAAPALPYIEGEITDRGDLDLKAASEATDVTVTLLLANGKTVILREAWAAGDWAGHTTEGNVSVRWEGLSGEEIPSAA